MRVQQASLDDLGAFTRLHEPSAHLLVVADGASGQLGARQAGKTAVEAIAQHIGEMVECNYNFAVELAWRPDQNVDRHRRPDARTWRTRLLDADVAG